MVKNDSILYNGDPKPMPNEEAPWPGEEKLLLTGNCVRDVFYASAPVR
jgi:hypothetical protein